MRGLLFSLVEYGTKGLSGLSSRGLAAVRDADLILHDEALPDVPFEAERISGYLQEKDGFDRLKKGQKVVRLCPQARLPHTALLHELRFLKKRGSRMDYIPCPETFNDVAWNLGLPWLSPESTEDFQLIQSLDCCNCRMFWYDLNHTNRTIAIDIARHQRPFFVERMLWELSDPDRPAALVDYVPMQHPVCWLTTLAELDEALSVWEPRGSTVMYIGQWPSRRIRKAIDADPWRQLIYRGGNRFMGQLA